MTGAMRAFSCLALALLAVLALPPMAISGNSLGGSFSVPLVISNVSASSIGASNATIRWETNGSASSQVFFDTQSRPGINDYAYNSSATLALVTLHNVYLSGLSPSTVYYYRVRSVVSVGGSDFVSVSQEFTFTTAAPGAPPPEPTPTPSPSPVPPPDPTPTPSPSPVPTPPPVVELEIATGIDVSATDTAGNSIAATGNVITVTGVPGAFVLYVPVTLPPGAILGSYTDASGLTYSNNRLEFPSTLATQGGRGLLRILDEDGVISTTIIIETGDAIGTSEGAVAEVLSIRTISAYTSRDFSADNPSLGEVSSTICLELNQLPDDAEIKITTSIEPDPGAQDAFQMAVRDSGGGDIAIAYTINVERINIENGTHIVCANITMVAGREWIEANGGVNAIIIMRYDPVTGEQQILETTFLGYDDGRAMFEGYSSDGLSIFALVGRIAPSHTVEPAPTSGLGPSPTPEPLQLQWWMLVMFIAMPTILVIIYIRIKKRR